MSPGSVDAAGSGNGALDSNADETDPILEAVNKLGPGDMVFAKFARYPWWPAIIVPCNQRKHKHADMYRIGGEDPKIAKFWVQFFNENSGAFVLLKNVFPFNPLELDKYACPRTNSHFQEQQKAFEMARDDFYVMNPGFPRGADETIPASPEEILDAENAELEDDAEAVPTKHVRPAKRKPAKSASAKSMKTKRARIAKPDKQEFGSVSSESGEDADPESVAMVAPEEVENSYEPDNESTREALDSDDAILAPSKPKKSPKVSSAKKSGKALALKEAKKEKGAAADKQKIRSLQRQIRIMTGDLEQEKEAHDASRKRIADLERKLKKARHSQKTVEKVKVLLPEVADALPAENPLESERCSKKLDAEEFQSLGARTHSAFSKYEALVKECGGLHNALLVASKKAEVQLQGSWDEMSSSMSSMEELERKLASLLRALYCADIHGDGGPDEAMIQTVTKIVKRIYRRVRVGDNSGLVLGRAHAVIESWDNEASKMRSMAHASAKDTDENASLSGALPKGISTSKKAVDEVTNVARDSQKHSEGRTDGHVDIQDKTSPPDDPTSGDRRRKKELAGEYDIERPPEGSRESKQDEHGEQRNDGKESYNNTEESNDGARNSEDSAEDGKGDFDESTSRGSSQGNQVATRNAVSRSPSGTDGEDGEGEENDALIIDRRKEETSDSVHATKPTTLSDAVEGVDGE